METVLLDTNVIIAYLDSTHDHHQIARNRIESNPRKFVMSVFSTIECLVMKFSDGYEHAVAFELDISTYSRIKALNHNFCGAPSLNL